MAERSIPDDLDWLAQVTRECMSDYAAQAKALKKLEGELAAARWMARRRREESQAADAAEKAAEVAVFEAATDVRVARIKAFEQLEKRLEEGRGIKPEPRIYPTESEEVAHG